MSNDTQPEIRFPGFTEDWEQRKLGEVIRFLNGKAYKQQELLDSGKYRVLRVGNFNTNDRWYYSDLELEENKYANKGDLLYLWATSFGPEIWNEETVIYHYHIWKLEFLTNELDKQYLYTWLLTDKEKIKQTTNGTTMVHVTKGIMEQRLFQFPQDVKEQQKIGAFFKQLDDTIALHQRKLDLLKETKKGFLQKMFPKNGAKVPEIRFPGFTGDWEQRKLGDITESFSGGTPTAGKSEYYGGDIPFIRSGEISSELTELFITENGLNNSSAKMVKAGDILYALYGATSGEVSISRINGAINQAILAIRPTKNDNSYLIVQWLRKQKDTIISTYLQGGQGNLSGSIVKDLVITLPQDKEEQNKIGTFFKQLDDTIALHQRKLDLLKETKKGFLQKMFV